jgi:uncharacterized membrane protein
VVAICLWATPGAAQTSPAAPDTPATTPPKAVEASVSHAVAKGLTYKAGSALKKLAIYSIGTGSVAAGGALAAITTVTSYAIYVANDYLWDTYSPNTNISANNDSFDTTESFWRNTTKYLTLKPIGMAATWTIVYLYTGSWTATVAMSTLSSLTGPIVFYANNVAWDWYDWYTSPPPKPGPQVQPEVAARHLRAEVR